MKSFIVLLTLLFVLLAFFTSIGIVYYVNSGLEVTKVEEEKTEAAE